MLKHKNVAIFKSIIKDKNSKKIYNNIELAH
jgi:hypothetical protein